MALSDLKKQQLQFAARMNRIGQTMRRAVNVELRALGLTEATWRPLFHLGQLGDGLRQKDLAESLVIEGPSLVPLLDNLEANGFVVRTEDASDRRCKIIRMTPAGDRIYKQTADIVVRVSARLLRVISEEELAFCFEIFDRLEAALDGLKSGSEKE
jgi:MarR family transcriptional regulator, transcriptional regulator for hemolysin